MRHTGIALVITTDNGRVEHPVSEESLTRVVSWLAPHVPGDSVWTVEEAS